MSSNIELVPFYTSLLRTIQNMFQAKLISEEQRSKLKNFVVTHETADLGPFFKSYENGQLEQYILETYIKEEIQQRSDEEDDDSCDSFSDIECQKSTLSCTPNLFVCQLKQSKQIQPKENFRKRSCSFTGEKDK